ncbi:MAG: putative cell surface protein/ lipoprotein, partial [bacterium]
MSANGECSWRAEIEGTPLHLLTADGKLYVSTRQGRIYCFGPEALKPRKYPFETAPGEDRDRWTAKAAEILATTKVRSGWCLAWGAGSGRLVTELARQSSLRIVAVEADAVKADDLRERLIREGILPDRLALLVGTPDSLTL